MLSRGFILGLRLTATDVSRTFNFMLANTLMYYFCANYVGKGFYFYNTPSIQKKVGDVWETLSYDTTGILYLMGWNPDYR